MELLIMWILSLVIVGFWSSACFLLVWANAIGPATSVTEKKEERAGPRDTQAHELDS